ncbi:zinc finger domain-containing protein [Tsukamurella sputi]|uniref:zinc finger domain-containing protein n=1 Tax=Tsukamurella sputi TaxID=2591848 RepID=UPI00131522E3|nr:hypothetical protein [Tsukamurella sputi]
MRDDQRAVALPCPACAARPGEKCTEPTNTGRRRVEWLHYSRTDQLEGAPA